MYPTSTDFTPIWKRKPIVIAVIVLAVLLLSLLTLRRTTGNGMLEVTAAATPNNAQVIVEVLGDGEKDELQSFKLKPGETKRMQVHTGHFRVTGTSGNMKSVDVVSVKGASTTKLITPSGEQRAVKQLASNATDCPAIFNNKVYTYTCGGEGPILKHESVLGAGDAFMYDALTFLDLERTKDGLIGYYSTEDPNQLQYIQPQNNSVQPVDLPASIKKLVKTERPNVITQKSDNSTRFLLTFSLQNKIFLFQDLRDSNPTEIKLDKGIRLDDEKRSLSITFNDDRVVAYAGVNDEAGEGTIGEASHTTELPLYEFEYDISGKMVQSAELPKDAIGTSFNRLHNNFYVLQRPYGLDFYYYQNNKFTFVYNLPEVANWAVYQGKLYMQEKGTIYEFIGREHGDFSLQSRFTSSHFTVSQLFNSPQGLLFTAFAGNDPNAPLNIYQLLSTKQVGDEPAIREQPIFTGLNTLLQYGLTEEQFNSLKAAFVAYTDSANIKLSGVSAQDVQPVSRDPNVDNPIDVISFTANINDQQFFKAKIEYSNLTSIRLYLFDRSTGAQVFDSQTVQ